MFEKFFDLLLDYLKARPYWPLLQPVLLLLSLYVISLVGAYQYIEWRYHFTPDLPIFLHSYLVKQISVVFLALALLALLMGTRWRNGIHTAAAKKIRGGIRSFAMGLTLAGIILILASAMFLHFAPHRVSHIKVKLMDAPASFDGYALTYIVYELNRLQADWHFTLDPDPLNKDSLASKDTARCGEDSLCYAKLIANNQPFIGITETGFNEDSFWINSGVVSVISAGQWKEYQPPSTYEYLAYSLIVQSTMIHLNRNCSGLPVGAFQQSRLSYGDLFEFLPRRNQMKAAILAAHLNPQGQELIANCFGLEYMNNLEHLLSLDWLRSGRVHDNLQKTFRISL
jgi:hypothetical protein